MNAAAGYALHVQRWEYRVVPWPAEPARVTSLDTDQYAEGLEAVLRGLGENGFELVQAIDRPVELGGLHAQTYLVLRRKGPSGEADYRRPDRDYLSGEL